jgi:hypothetical protein
MKKKITNFNIFFLAFLSIIFLDNFSKKIPTKIIIRKRPKQNNNTEKKTTIKESNNTQIFNKIKNINLLIKKKITYNKIISKWASRDIVFSCKEYEFFETHRNEIISFIFLIVLNKAIEKKFRKIYVNKQNKKSEEKFFMTLNENIQNIKKKLNSTKDKDFFFFFNKTQKYILNITKTCFGKLNIENIDKKKRILSFFEKNDSDIILNLISEYKELIYFAFNIEKFSPLKNVVKKILKEIFDFILKSKETLFYDFLSNRENKNQFNFYLLNENIFLNEKNIINEKNKSQLFHSLYFASMENINIKENGEILSRQFKKLHNKIIKTIFSISEINFSPKSNGKFYLSNFKQKNFDGIEIIF